ncbi:universal stress protein [Polaromonas sp. JS666]|uniref:universal stress protein n=1 Tax=Polaromonas sp. (strain JS666 / ATCC BAA-500) TaxID=296591 RepID=UPI0008913C35|nr:universal stress protein [Polaromonas sp. JS666]SDM45020.1 Nucleotide-binding universal stress protein, UspA family [Polaromonas sp. JS666]
MFKRILIPVDGSDTSTKALVAGLQMARETGASVRLVHFVNEMAYLSGIDPYGSYSADLAGMMREGGAKVLADAMAVAQSASVEVSQVLLEEPGNRLGEAVATAARQWGADLVVVGSHGRRGIGRVLMGSGAEQILRLAPVPVLVIRGAAPAEGGEHPVD